MLTGLVVERHVSARLVECRGGRVRSIDRREGGRGHAGAGGAWCAESVPPRPPAAPPDPAPLAAAAGADALVQMAAVRLRVERPGTAPLEHDSLVATAVLARSSPLGPLRQTALAARLSAPDLAALASALAAAGALAARARPIEAAGAVLLPAPVAATLAGALLPQAGEAPETVPAGPLRLVDDGRPEGGPLGAPFDAAGEPTRRLVLWGEGRARRDQWPHRLESIGSPPRRAPLQPRLEALDPAAEPPPARWRALAVAGMVPRGQGVAFRLVVEDEGGAGGVLVLALDLPGLFAGVAAAGAEPFHTPAGGSPWLVLEAR